MAIDLSQFAGAFQEEALEHAATMESLLLAASTQTPDEESLNAIFRAAHSIKGGAGAFGYRGLTAFTHDLESLLDRVRKGELALTKPMVEVFLRCVDALREHLHALRAGKPADGAAFEELREDLLFLVSEDSIGGAGEAEDESYGFFAVEAPAPVEAPVEAPAAAVPTTEADSIRINVAKIDELVNLVGELVITQAMVARGSQAQSGAGLVDLANAVAQLERNTRDLQRSILSIRMLPIRHVTCRLPRLVHDVADRLGREVELEMLGEDTELDKGLIEKLADPLMHLVRNAIDHGIEPPDERLARGKQRAGRLQLRARHEGGKVVISVSDDGAGLDRDAILAKAREAGIEIDPLAGDAEVRALIFRPGFSTAKSVSDVSGRGVGMDVVQKNVHALGGTIEIDSVASQGTTITLRLPLTLAIIEGMSIVADGESYVVPLTAIAQSVRPDACETRTLGGREVMRFNGNYIPLVSLGGLFGHATPKACAGGVHVVLDIDGRHAAIRADRLVGLHQTVVKGLEDHYRRVDGVSGATILGDGRVALILDAQRVVERAGA